MAGPLKNVSTLLSPSLRTTLSPSRNLLSTPKHQRITSCAITPRKLNFSPNLRLPYQGKVPDIKVDLIFDKSKNNFQNEISPNPTHVLDLNSPIKQDLAKNGLQPFRKCTKVLGQGSFGVVFKGRHHGEVVAVKLVTKETVNQEKNALGLNHRNVINTITVIENPDWQAYNLVIMEYLANCRSLQDTLDAMQAGPLQEDNTNLLKLFAIDITAGLAYLHHHGVMHLDLKPKNILVSRENVCKICDFGNSLKIGDSSGQFNYTGTVIYTAPEVLMGKSPTTKSDIYSLGLIFWQLKYLKSPFQEYERNESIIYNVGKNNLRPKYQENGTNCIVDIFTKCWDTNPDQRPDALQVLKMLEKFTF
uniref:non-specific serine/threonine protein kinase n=1 Tax=Dendroctonus ponderosae TaxID=77166 RepID=A0AAR5Q3B0_DENPD